MNLSQHVQNLERSRGKRDKTLHRMGLACHLMLRAVQRYRITEVRSNFHDIAAAPCMYILLSPLSLWMLTTGVETMRMRTHRSVQITEDDLYSWKIRCLLYEVGFLQRHYHAANSTSVINPLILTRFRRAMPSKVGFRSGAELRPGRAVHIRCSYRGIHFRDRHAACPSCKG